MEKKMWLIDDNDVDRFITKKMLEKCNSELKIKEFVNGFEAIKKIEKENPDVIILDINMPVMDGWDFLEGLELISYNREKFIYMLSSSNNPKDVDRAKTNKYVLDYLIKPMNKEMVDRICMEKKK